MEGAKLFGELFWQKVNSTGLLFNGTLTTTCLCMRRAEEKGGKDETERFNGFNKLLGNELSLLACRSEGRESKLLLWFQLCSNLAGFREISDK